MADPQRDHLHQAEQIRMDIFRRMTPEQKLHIANDLYWSARRLKSAWISQTHPQWSAGQVEKAVREIFLYA